MAIPRLERLDLERLDRLPALERGITIGDFLVPVPIGERMGLRPYHLGLVLSGAALIALGALVSIPVPGSPVPVTAQVLAVLVVGAALGVRRGLLAVLLYLALGIAGLPDFPDRRTGLDVFASVRGGQLVLAPVGGFLVGDVIAAAAVGRLAELGWDRTVGRAVVTMSIGLLLVSLVGLPWLGAALGYGPARTLEVGLFPFLLGDLLTVGLAAVILPTAWWLIRRRPVAN